MLGFLLSDALALTGARETIVLETAPPFVSRAYTPIWGEWRVVRVRETPGGALELLVARELLREEKAVPRD